MIIYSKFLTDGTEGEGLDLFYWNLGDLEVDVMSRFLKKFIPWSSKSKRK